MKPILFSSGFMAFALFVALAPPAQAMSLTNSEIFSATSIDTIAVNKLIDQIKPIGGDILASAGTTGLSPRRSPISQTHLKNTNEHSGLIAFDASGTRAYLEVGWS